MKRIISIILISVGCLLIVTSLILSFSSKKNNNSNDKPKDNSNDKPNDKSDDKKKENILENNGWVYILPEGWKDEGTDSNGRSVTFPNTVDGVTCYNGTHFNISSSKPMKTSMDELFSESSIFIKTIENSTFIKLVEDHKIIQHNNKPVMIFPFKFVDDESSLAFRVLTPADDEYYYDFQLYSNRIIDGQDEMFFNYDAVLLFVDFLNTGVKKDS